MAAWYNPIYVFVRRYRLSHPLLGLFLHCALNFLLSLQIIWLILLYYVYTWLICLRLTSLFQQAVYLIIFNVIFLMLIWSLSQTLFTRTMRAPKRYCVDEKTDIELKALTPFLNDRYMADLSTAEQIDKQTRILENFAKTANLGFVEVDSFKRLRYCYQCALIKPDRSHHCTSCGACVLRFDHHCPWINKCISYSNYKFFILYQFYFELMLILVGVTGIEVCLRLALSQCWSECVTQFVLVTAAVFVSWVFCYKPIGDFLFFSLQITSLNETTCEQIRIPIVRGDPQGNYNMGLLGNLSAVFGWGLWAFPVATHMDDGLHYQVNYSSTTVTHRMNVRRIDGHPKAIDVVA